MTQVDDASELIDPEIAEPLAAFGFDGVSDLESLGAIRDAFEQFVQPLGSTDAVERSDHVVAADHPVPIRVHRPRGLEGPAPCVYAIHGGGMVLGSYLLDDNLFEDLCPRLGVVGVSVEYRLAPESPYPLPLDDCEAGFRWTIDHADELGIDPARVGLYGVSAGAGLAAGLALRLRDDGGPAVAFQFLETPMLDDRQRTWSSQLDGLPIWSRESNTFGWRSYLGALYGGEVPAEAAPARADDLAGLPPTCVTVGTADGFRDEAVDHAMRLAAAGVACQLFLYPGAPHGFQAFATWRITEQNQRDRVEWLTWATQER